MKTNIEIELSVIPIVNPARIKFETFQQRADEAKRYIVSKEFLKQIVAIGLAKLAY
jgi:hypothetical protein